MATAQQKQLLKDPRVIDEINRHLWLESEKAGQDIGFDRAADDWLTKYSAEWKKINQPAKKKAAAKKKSSSTGKRGAKKI